MNFAFGALSVIVLCLVIRYAEGITVKLEWSFHKKMASWNTAVDTCEANGGNLIKIDTETKSKVFEYYLRQNEDDGDGDFWIGLFNNNIPDESFYWTDCASGRFTNWANGEPNQPGAKNCVRGLLATLKWRTNECDSYYQFVCEKTKGDCTFYFMSHKYIPNSSKYETSVLADKSYTLQDCQTKCQDRSFTTDMDCFGLTLSPSGTCSLHAAIDPLEIMSAGVRSRTGYTVSYRVCYEAIKETDSIPDEFFDSNLPFMTCEEITTTETVGTTATEIFVESTPGTTATETPQSNPPSTVGTTESIPSSTSSKTTGQRPTLTHNTPVSENLSSVISTSTERVQISTENSNTQLSTLNSLVYNTTPTPGVDESTEHFIPQSSTLLDRLTSRTDVQTNTCNGPSCHSSTSSTLQPNLISSSTEMSVTKTNRCPCPCGTKTSDAVISKILETLVVEKKQLSTYKRKYISAPDSRPSSQAIGYFGVVILSIVFGGLIIIDIPKLFSDVKVMHNSFKRQIKCN